MCRLSIIVAACAAVMFGTAVHAQPAQPPAAPPPPPEYGSPIMQELAMKVAAATQAKAKEIGQRVVISIVGPAGDLIYFTKMDGAQYGSIEVSLHKAKTSALYRRPTMVFEQALAKGGGAMSILLLPNVIASGGGVPLIVGGKLIGALGVSGSPTGTIDAEAAAAGVAALK